MVKLTAIARLTMKIRRFDQEISNFSKLILIIDSHVRANLSINKSKELSLIFFSQFDGFVILKKLNFQQTKKTRFGIFYLFPLPHKPSIFLGVITWQFPLSSVPALITIFCFWSRSYLQVTIQRIASGSFVRRSVNKRKTCLFSE